MVVAASFSGPMQSDAAAVAEIACAGLIANDGLALRLSPSRAFKDCLINISGSYLYIANVGCGAWSYDNG